MYTINVYRKKVELQNGATFFKYVTKVGDNWYSVRFAKEAKKALADFYVPRQIKLNDGDYFITLDKDKNGNVIVDTFGNIALFMFLRLKSWKTCLTFEEACIRSVKIFIYSSQSC